MVIADRRDNAHQWNNGVRGVEAAPGADLNDGNINLAFGKPGQSECGPHLGVVQRLSFWVRLENPIAMLQYLPHHFVKGKPINERRTDLELLGRNLKIGGSAKASSVAGGRQNRGNRCRRRSLPGRASDMDDGILTLGIPEGTQQRSCASEFGFGSSPPLSRRARAGPFATNEPK